MWEGAVVLDSRSQGASWQRPDLQKKSAPRGAGVRHCRQRELPVLPRNSQEAIAAHREGERQMGSRPRCHLCWCPRTPVLGRDISEQVCGRGHGFLKGTERAGERGGERERRGLGPRKQASLQGRYRVCCCSLAAT